jgi:hypothetical protein
MRTSVIIYFVLAVMFATIGCIVPVFSIPVIAWLWFVPWILLNGPSEFKPIPRKERWLAWVVFSIPLALSVAFDILHLREPHGVVCVVLSAVMWIAWMFAVYYRWQIEMKS